MHYFTALSILDLVALCYFLLVWGGYSRFAEMKRNKQKCLNQIMEQYRHIWFKTSLKREQRMIDTGVMSGLQNGTAFFASCALFAIGGSISLLKNPETLLSISSHIPGSDRDLPIYVIEAKLIGLTLIFVYAFFKLAWAYRLFNYSAIMIGAAPVKEENHTQEAKDISERGARLNVVASKHFNRGMRAFFFALGYLGWFIHPLLWIVTSTFVGFVVFRRTFSSDAVKALQ